MSRAHDEVEHDGGDDLVRAAPRLERAGDRRRRARRRRRRRRGSAAARRRRRAAPAAGARPTSAVSERADGELALGADVEQAGAQRQRDRQAGEDERRGLEQHLADAVARCPRCRRAAGDRRASGAPPTAMMSSAGAPASAISAAHSARQDARVIAFTRRAPIMSAPICGAHLGAALGRVVDAAGDAAAVEHGDAVGEREQLVEIGGDEQHRAAARRARARSSAWMRSMAPTSTPRVGCAQTARASSARQLAADHDLLLVAARQRATPARRDRAGARRAARSCARVVGGRGARRSSAVDRRGRGSRLSATAKSRTRPRAWRSSGTWARPRRGARADARRVTSCAVEQDAPARGAGDAGDRQRQLGLAVALDAGDAEDLAARAPTG